jgi:hypothetical protein
LFLLPFFEKKRYGSGGLDEVSRELTDFNNNVGALRKLTEKIGTARDTNDFRSQLAQRREGL